VADSDARFRRLITLVLAALGLLTAGSVLLFGHLLFKALSKDVVNDAILHTRLDAERLARGIAERSAGDPYLLKLKVTEIDRLVRAGVSERQILAEVEVLDNAKKEVLYSYNGTLTVPERSRPAVEDSKRLDVRPIEPGTASRSWGYEAPEANPYDLEVPVGDFAVLRFGVSRRVLAERVEKLRRELYLRTFAAASVALLGIAAASAAVLLLIGRTRRAEEARVEAGRLAELGEVAAGLAHEIRNPLNAMGLNLELLEEQLRDAARTGGPPPAELAQAARQETTRLSRLLADFLSYARPSPLSTVPADLNEAAGDAVAFLAPEAERRAIRLAFTPHSGSAPARLDPARVRQVVLNLVANALDAVEAEGASAREVDVRVEDAGAKWRLSVADRGPGVPPAKTADLFKLFVSTKPAGTGLGLPIAERIVKAHGGALTLTSRPGEPTRAEATFPKSG
jgi:signal transduction histidine kinase